ncbi:NADH:flavin oxidoreductase [Limoniibacter endophyticus]|uniref:N-methylproline demethylase n=1 Tax=Limoniibacter endophyticus TaxID=1565040 RepID=A0A8J3GGZ3_9HYPH|nr:NADH:flavin oxidoreductase [Limoniibacter endophyticus]GHC68046.1 N-methylproline demethylase [Limoniibacter endophyticus]
MYQQKATNAKADPLLQPLKIKHLELRNRIMSTSHACGLEVGGMPLEAYQRYHEEKARGGLALSMFGGSSNVDLDSPNVFRQLNVGTNAIIPHFQQFAERMHRHGAALMCQITHLGRRGESYGGDRLAMIAPSPIRETLHRSIPREMDEHDIDRVVKAFANAALRCKEGGLDGIETHAGGHMIGQFLSPIANRRTDRFGGSLENRMRFPLMVHEAIRRAVGDDFIVGIRMAVDEGPGGGMNFEESVKVAQALRDIGGIDFFNAIYGMMDTTRGLAEDAMPGMGSPLAPWIEPVGRFRQELDIPVFHAARISDIASARFAIREGKVDMAGMTRAQIADPYLASKLAQGKEEEIRPCVGATHCQSPHRPACLHNPATGRETVLPHVYSKSGNGKRKVVIVGGGPAGLEAARISAERGHEVSLFEAASELGGQLLLGAKGSWRTDLLGIVEWRVAELNRLGVTMQTNAYLDDSEIMSLDPDVVLLATGGMPQIDLLHGGDLCASTWDILSGQAKLSGDVLIFDGTGRHPAPLAAEKAVGVGAKVHFVTIDAQLGEELTYAEKVRWKKLFLKFNLYPKTETRLTAVERQDNRLVATLVNDISREVETLVVDHVVVEQGSVPSNDIFDALRSHSSNDGVTDLRALIDARPQPQHDKVGFELHRIGDALASRNVHSAMLDAMRLCSSL